MVPLMNWKAFEGMLEKVYKPESPDDWTGMKWMGNNTSMPRDSPECGWKGELCELKSNTLIITLITLSVSIIIIVLLVGIGGISLRKKRQLMSLKVVESALIKWENMKCSKENHDTDRSIIYEYNHMNIVAKSLYSNYVDMTNKQVFTEVLWMREINHPNVNQFVGICTDSPTICIAMAYAYRGSLSDIIEDGSTQFDVNFKTSILADIASGMWYLHQSPVGSHGQLTSYKCVLDSKWTCKITGHGLESLRNKYIYDRNTMLEANNASKFLWAAPEFLVNTKKTQKTLEKQMGDVYSFGIITQEVLLGTRPYGYNDVYDDDIILERVRIVEEPPFRPEVDEGEPELITLMMNC